MDRWRNPEASGPLSDEEKERLKAAVLRMLPGWAVIRRALGDTTPVALRSSLLDDVTDPAIIRAWLQLTRYRLH